MAKRKHNSDITKEQKDDNDRMDNTTNAAPYEKRRRRVSDVIDSSSDRDSFVPLGHRTPKRTSTNNFNLESPDQGYSATPDSAARSSYVNNNRLIPEWMLKTSDVHDGDSRIPDVSNEESADQGYLISPVSESGTSGSFLNSRVMPEWVQKTPDVHDANPQIEDDTNEKDNSTELIASLSTLMDSDRYYMSHKYRGKCVVFNHEYFDMGFDPREGTKADAERIERTFRKLGFFVEVLPDREHSKVVEKIIELSGEDHTDNDCICIFVLTHGLNNGFICAKDVAYKADNIWKPFTADKSRTLAGKPKLFFYQACRGDKLDPGVVLQRSGARTATDSAIASYKIPTHADFLIAHSTVDGFYSWRNPQEGTWYIQCLCDVLEKHSETTDLLKMLTITARKVATEYSTFNDIDPSKHDKKQVPVIKSMLIRDVYFVPKENQHT